MQYFTKEMWSDFQNLDDDVFDKTKKQWEHNVSAYNSQLNKILLKLSKRNSHFFTNISLHDCRLLSFTTGDLIDKDFVNFNNQYHQKRYKVKVHLTVASYNYIYDLYYTDIKRCILDYPTDRPLFFFENTPFDDWGYDELTEVGDGIFKHEILFSSGSSILIEFKKFSYSRTKIIYDKSSA